MDVAISLDHRRKTEKKTTNFWILPECLKKLWNIKLALIAIVVGGLGMVSQGFEKKQKLRELREIHLFRWSPDQRKRWGNLDLSTVKIS